MDCTRWGGVGVQLLLVVAGAAAERGRAPAPPPDATPAIVSQSGAPAAEPVEPARLATLPEAGGAWAVRFAPDASRVAWLVVDDAGERLVVNGTPGPAFDTIAARYVVGEAGGPVAYAARRGDRWHPVVDHSVGEGYDSVSPPTAGPDGRRVAFVVTLDGASYVRCGRDLHGPYQGVEGLAWSGDGRRVAWIARRAGVAQVIQDGRPLVGSVGIGSRRSWWGPSRCCGRGTRSRAGSAPGRRGPTRSAAVIAASSCGTAAGAGRRTT
jgi:hypothetical protein